MLEGRQVMNLTADDIPIVARAIDACIRKQASISTVQVNNVSMVHIVGVGFDLRIRAEDWLLIAPYLADETFNPDLVAFPVTHGDPPLNVATIDLQDATLYHRLVVILSSLFTKKFPTSKL